MLSIKELLIKKGLLTEQEIQDRLDKFAEDATVAKTIWENRHFFDGLRQRLKGENKEKED